MTLHHWLGFVISGYVSLSGLLHAQDNLLRIAPPKEEKQLPFAMHSSMAQLPHIRVANQEVVRPHEDRARSTPGPDAVSRVA